MGQHKLKWVFLLICVCHLPILSAADCNENGVDDATDIAAGTGADCNGNGIPDGCDVVPSSLDFLITEFPTGRGPGPGPKPGLVAVDLTGDGVLDLATANHQSNSVSVLVGVGDGSFKEQNSFGVGAVPTAAIKDHF